MADFFGSIAAGEIGSKRAPLVFPEPTPKNGVVFPLEKTSGKTPHEVYKKIDTRAELDFEIEKLKTKYEPFMQKLAPIPKSRRESISLSAFSLREATPEDFKDFSRVLRGEGEWKSIAVPYFFGPVGNACFYYRTTFEIGKPEDGEAIFLHFDGVDYIAEVFVNGSFAGSHEGFFGAFEFDVSPYIRDGENTLVITVRNDYVYGGNPGPTTGAPRLEGDKLYAATGFGYDDSELGWHHCPPGMGICQKVTVERRARALP